MENGPRRNSAPQQATKKIKPSSSAVAEFARARVRNQRFGEASRPRRGKTLCGIQLLVGGRGGDAQEDQNSTIQPHQIFVSKAGDTRADLGPRNGRDLIYHQSADSAQAVVRAWLDRQPKQGSISWVGGECAHRDRTRHVETGRLEESQRDGAFPRSRYHIQCWSRVWYKRTWRQRVRSPWRYRWTFSRRRNEPAAPASPRPSVPGCS